MRSIIATCALLVLGHGTVVPVAHSQIKIVGAMTVCDFFRQRTSFDGKKVVVRGKVETAPEGQYLVEYCPAPFDEADWPPQVNLSNLGKGLDKIPSAEKDLDIYAVVVGIAHAQPGVRYARNAFAAEIVSDQISFVSVSKSKFIGLCELLKERARLAGQVVSVRGELLELGGERLLIGRSCGAGSEGDSAPLVLKVSPVPTRLGPGDWAEVSRRSRTGAVRRRLIGTVTGILVTTFPGAVGPDGSGLGFIGRIDRAVRSNMGFETGELR